MTEDKFKITLPSGSTITGLFPIPIFQRNLGREFTKKEIAICDPASWQLVPSSDNRRAVNTNILDTPSLFNIKQFILGCLDEYKNNILEPITPMSLTITQSWINYGKKGDKHHKHFHANSIVSGVFYFKIEQQDPINFYDLVKSNLHILGNPNYWNISRMNFNSIPGDLILFPSWVEHDVDEVRSDNVRISLSFNTWFTGYIGSSDALTGLKS
jgi:hypothetical protein